MLQKKGSSQLRLGSGCFFPPYFCEMNWKLKIASALFLRLDGERIKIQISDFAAGSITLWRCCTVFQLISCLCVEVNQHRFTQGTKHAANCQTGDDGCFLRRNHSESIVRRFFSPSRYRLDHPSAPFVIPP